MNIKKRNLRNRIEQGEFICAPGVFDLISARIADRLEFPALYMTGYGVVASSLGLPDAGLAGYSDICLLYTSPSPRDLSTSRMPSSA